MCECTQARPAVMLASRSRVGRQRSDPADLVLAVAVDRGMPKALAEIAVRTVVDRWLLRLGPLLHWGPHANPRRTRPRQPANRSRNDARARGVRTHQGQGRQTPSGTSLSSGQTLRRWRSRAGRLRHALLLPVACRARALQKGGSAKADGSSAPEVFPVASVWRLQPLQSLRSPPSKPAAARS